MERRKHARTDVTVEVDICHPDGECIGHIRDLSPRSVFVEVEGGPRPEVGSRIKLNFLIWTGEYHLSRQAHGEITRGEEEGIAILFAEQDSVARAVIVEMLYYMGIAQTRRVVSAA